MYSSDRAIGIAVPYAISLISLSLKAEARTCLVTPIPSLPLSSVDILLVFSEFGSMPRFFYLTPYCFA
jgi:hypothetical protein